AGSAHPMVVRAMKLARHRGARTLAITDATLSEVAEHAELMLYYSSNSPSFLQSNTSLLAIVQALAYGVYAQDKAAFKDRIRAFTLTWPGSPARRSGEPAGGEPLRQGTHALVTGDVALAHRAVALGELGRQRELGFAAQLAGRRSQLVDQLHEPVAGRLAQPGVEIGERSLDAVARRPPAVLRDHPVGVGRELFAGVDARAEPGDERLGERRYPGCFAHGGLRVGDAQLERPEARVRAQLPPPRVRLRDGARVRAPLEGPRVLLPGAQRRRHALARELFGDLRADG